MPRWTLEVVATFEAAHHLRSWRGAAEPSHGHSWRVVARLETSTLDDEGMAYDFVTVREALGEIVGRVDHRDLNAVPPFDRESPTTERVARWFFEELGARLPEAPLAAVTVWEGPGASVTYAPGSEEVR